MAIEVFPFKVRYIGETIPRFFTNGQIYEVIGKEFDSYRIIDDSGEDYMYHLDEDFEIIE